MVEIHFAKLHYFALREATHTVRFSNAGCTLTLAVH